MAFVFRAKTGGTKRPINKMPRIDPLSLLKCLSVLLGPTGGIKSKEEVHRLANLMTKFSKKLVSKCIYIQILKTTNTDLLSQFMSAGGWNLIHTWLTDGILAKNWALIQELLELLLLCPVDIERLKSNNCPKLIKGLSKEGSHQGVRTLASRLVEQWLKIVKGEAAPNSVPAQIMTVPVQSSSIAGQTAISQQQQQHSANTQQTVDPIENATIHMQDFKLAQQSTASISINQQDQEKPQLQERLQPQTVQVISKAQQAQAQQQVTQQQCKKQSFVVVSTSSSLPVYKITIRDGNQVLAKVETDAVNISNVLNTPSTSTNSEYVSNATLETKPETEAVDETEENGAASGRDDVIDVVQSDDSSGHVPSEVKQTVVSSKDNQDSEGVKSKDVKDSKDISDSGKSSDKENRDSHKKDDKKSNSSSSSSSEKKSSGHHHGSSSSSLSSSSKSSKHGTSSSAHRSSSTSHRSSSHRSGSSSSSSSSKNSNSSKDRSSKDKDKHHSSSSSKHSSNRSKSERDKEREKEKEKQKKDQAEKDKATLEKVQGQALSSKMGKIPKKRTEDEKSSSDANGRKSSTESRDSSKENKEKADSKKDAVATKLVTEKKNISISIENRKNSQDSGIRPKTVKTFNSKFRSTGLEEEVKPPPPRSKKATPATDKKVLPPKLPLKRPSPLRDVPLVEKRAKISLDSPTTPPSDEKKGGIKLIPPKPKPMMLQESDMFMDALTASTKSKEPRKRKRRASITKDGASEAKKQEAANTDNRESTPPPASPSNVEEKSPVALKPNFKFYQDTLEIEEDKDQKEKESGEEESKKDKDQMYDEEKDSRDDDDIGSNTPTPDDDVEEIKEMESPEDASSVVSDSTKKDSYPEIRYVDGLKSVLLLQKRKGPKKVLKWKTDLESIRYFELDETERVNVTKTFTDMKQMEKQNEREAFQMARKLNTEDLMEERTRWKPLIPIDQPPPLVEPGKDSKEKDIQYAREKGILQALYFNRSMIPDSAAEPDEERHHVMTDPKIIPLDDLTGNKESEKDFTAVPWPEPKPQPPQPSTVTTFHYPTTYPHNQQNMMTTIGPQSTMGGPMPQIPQQMMAPTHMAPMSQEMTGPMPATGGGGWRTGDGKVLVPDISMNPMANMSSGFNQGMEGGPMVPPGMMGPPPIYNQEGYNMICPDDMGYNNFQGPPGPMYGPGPNFPAPRGALHNRGRGGPGWGYRGPVRGGWRGVGGGWRGSGKQPPVCRQFSKNGYCRVGDKCQYLHPGVNCPPF